MTEANDRLVEELLDAGVDTQTGEYGGLAGHVPTGSSVFGSIDLPPQVSEETTVSVSGYAYEDEPCDVEITAYINGATVWITLSADRAREFADEIRLAALAADRGLEIDEAEK